MDQLPAPQVDPDGPLQMLITTLDYNDYVGRIGIGRVFAGTLQAGHTVTVIHRDGTHARETIGELFVFEGLGRRKVDRVPAGDICAVVGLESVDIGNTIADPEDPQPLPLITIEEPTLHMTMRINDSPFVGRSGKYLTSQHLRERLEKECQHNVALRVDPGPTLEEFHVSGRGLLHLSVLIENMRREGYELAVGKPKVIFRELDGRKTEPIELCVVDVPADHIGAVMELLGARRGICGPHGQRGRTDTSGIHRARAWLDRPAEPPAHRHERHGHLSPQFLRVRVLSGRHRGSLQRRDDRIGSWRGDRLRP